MEQHTSFMNWKNQCRRITTQGIQQIQSNSYQITNGIFHRTRRDKLKFCMETRKILKSQNNLEDKTKKQTSTSGGNCLTLQLLQVVDGMWGKQQVNQNLISKTWVMQRGLQGL